MGILFYNKNCAFFTPKSLFLLHHFFTPNFTGDIFYTNFFYSKFSGGYLLHQFLTPIFYSKFYRGYLLHQFFTPFFSPIFLQQFFTPNILHFYTNFCYTKIFAFLQQIFCIFTPKILLFLHQILKFIKLFFANFIQMR